MQRMLIRFGTLALVMVSLVSAGLAQEEGKRKDGEHKGFNPERFLGGSIQTLTEKLSLTDEQKAKLEAMVQDIQKKAEEIRAKAESGDVESLREEFQNLKTSVMDQLKSILTEDQQARLKEFAQSKRKEIGNRIQSGLMNLKLLEEKLDLTEDQILEVKEILSGIREDFKRIREVAGEDREKMKAAMKELQDQIVLEIKEILTDEQKQTLDAFLKEMQEKQNQRKSEEKN